MDSRQTGWSRPPFINPAFANGTNVLAVPPDGLTLPRFQNWSVTYQRQLNDNMMLDVSYIGNRGSRLNHHLQTLRCGRQHERSERPEARRQRPAVEHQFAGGAGRRHHAALCGLQRERGAGAAEVSAVPDDPVARRAHGKSQYHAMEIVLERRFSRGLQARLGYTYSRLHNNGAESAQGDNGINGGVQNPADPLEWQLSADDTPHVFLTGFTWEMPGSARWTSAVTKALFAGWNVAGVFRYESGRPFNITMANDLGGLLFNGQKRPNRVSGVDGVAATATSIRTATVTSTARPGPIRVRWQFGNAPKRDTTVRSFPVYSEDLNIFKVFHAAQRAQDPVRIDIRQHLQSDAVLRPEHELELRRLRADQHAMQPAALDSVRVEVRVLVRSGAWRIMGRAPAVRSLRQRL